MLAVLKTKEKMKEAKMDLDLRLDCHRNLPCDECGET